MDIMLEGEADRMFRRQVHELGQTDHLTDLMVEMKLQPETVLEVGCSNGWRVAKLSEMFGARCLGIDPSASAIEHGRAHGLTLRRGAADMLPVNSNWADLVIYGFCLYLTDPEDWLRIAAEGDRVVKPGGIIAVHDFNAGGEIEEISYKHDPRLVSYHFDFARLWLAHPRYSLLRRRVYDSEMITLLRKSK